MHLFSVLFQPTIRNDPIQALDTTIDWIELAKASEKLGLDEYNVVFQIDGRNFEYYQCDVVGLIDDMLAEYGRLDSSGNHLPTISGYTILLVEVIGDDVILSDPYDSQKHWNRLVSRNQMKLSLEEAARKLLSLFVSPL